MGNKLELAGPLTNPATLFVPWPVFRHILVLIRGYSGEVHGNNDSKKFTVTIKKRDTVAELFSKARFSAECIYPLQTF